MGKFDENLIFIDRKGKSSIDFLILKNYYTYTNTRTIFVMKIYIFTL